MNLHVDGDASLANLQQCDSTQTIPFTAFHLSGEFSTMVKANNDADYMQELCHPLAQLLSGAC